MYDNLKNAFEKIGPTDEQKIKMAKAILSSNRKGKIHMMRHVGILSACAAVFLIAVSIYTFNYFWQFKEQTAGEVTLMDNKVTEKKKNEKKEEIVIEKKKDEKKEEIVIEKKKDEKKEEIVIEKKKNEKQHQIAQQPDAHTIQKYDNSNSASDSDTILSDTSDVVEGYNDEITTFKFKADSNSVFVYNEFSLFQEPMMNTACETESSALESGAVYDEENARINTDDVSENKLADVLNLPDDLSAEDSNVYNTESQKDHVYTYSGDEGRTLTITVSEDSQDYDKFASNNDINKTVISDSTIILFSDEGVYGGYFTKDGYQYKVFSNLLSQSEFEDAITSIVE